MSDEETILPDEWYAIAERDLGASKVLLGQADLVTLEPDFAEFMPACIKISAYYAEYRYSLRLPSPLSRAEVQESLTQAELLIARIQSRTH